MNVAVIGALFGAFLGRYALVLLGLWLLAGIAFALPRRVFPRTFAPRRIQQRPVDRAAVLHDLRWSALNLAANSAVAMLIAWLVREGVLRIETAPTSAWTIAGQFAVYFVLFDAYFYALHRLLHTPRLFRAIHRHHHRSSAPTPFTAFAFHPIEGLLSNHFVTLLMLALPLHLHSLIAIYAYGVLSSLLVHGGHEVFPRSWYRGWATRWYLTPAFHDFHHARPGCNFGGFTTLWDRAFGTVAPRFSQPAPEGRPVSLALEM